MAYLNLGALPPPKTLTVTLPQAASSGSSFDRPRTTESALAASKRFRTPDTLEGVKMIGWDRVQRALVALNPRFIFREMPDARVAVGLEAPSSIAARAYDAEPSHIRKDMDDLRYTPGPRIWIITASRGFMACYYDILDKHGKRILARSLMSIVKACVDYGYFTFEDAEAKFGMRFRGQSVGKKFVDLGGETFNAAPVLVSPSA